jgi:hypothetical protein
MPNRWENTGTIWYIALTAGAARNPGKTVILSAAKNLAGITEILRCAQNDRNARKNCRPPCGKSWTPFIDKFAVPGDG